jgi:hypothetical protein
MSGLLPPIYPQNTSCLFIHIHKLGLYESLDTEIKHSDGAEEISARNDDMSTSRQTAGK